LQDYWPSYARMTGTVAFQRVRPSQDMGVFFGETRIFLSPGNVPDFQYARLQVEDGFAPQLSPDGRWLAFLRTPAGAATQPTLAMRPEVWLNDLRSQRARLIGEHLRLGSFALFPLERLERNLVWSPDSAVLYSIHRTDGGYELRRFLAGSVSGSQELITSGGERRIELRDPFVSPDGKQLAYSSHQSRESVFKIHVRNLESEAERVVFEDHTDAGVELLCRGWVSSSSLLLVRSHLQLDLPGSRLEVMLLDTLHGQSRPLSIIENGLDVSLRLDATRQVLYMTAIEGRAHNLHALDLESGSLRKLTSNQIPGVTYSGIEVTAQGELLYSRQRTNTDIKQLRFRK
jgi:hypothetical protein